MARGPHTHVNRVVDSILMQEAKIRRCKIVVIAGALQYALRPDEYSFRLDRHFVTWQYAV